MHVEAGDGVQDGRFRHVDRHIRGQLRQQIGDTSHPIGKQQHLLRHEMPLRRGLRQHPQHDGSLRDEAILPPGQIPLADIAKLGDAWIVRRFDGDRPQDRHVYCPAISISATMRPTPASKTKALRMPSAMRP